MNRSATCKHKREGREPVFEAAIKLWQEYLTGNITSLIIILVNKATVMLDRVQTSGIKIKQIKFRQKEIINSLGFNGQIFRVLRVVVVVLRHILIAVTNQYQNSIPALVLKTCEITSARAAATCVPDRIEHLSLALGNGSVTALSPPPLALAGGSSHQVTMIVGNDTGRLIAQVNTLISRVTEALLFFLPDHLVHTSCGTLIEGPGAPVIATVPPISANTASNTVLEASPCRGTGVSKITPDSHSLTTSCVETVIEVTTTADCGAPGGPACWIAIGPACGPACWTATVVFVNTATILTAPVVTRPFARNTAIASVPSNAKAVGVVGVFKGDEHVVVGGLVLEILHRIFERDRILEYVRRGRGLRLNGDSTQGRVLWRVNNVEKIWVSVRKSRKAKSNRRRATKQLNAADITQ